MILGPAPSFARSNRMLGPLNFLAAADTSAMPALAISSNARHWYPIGWPAPEGFTRARDVRFAEGRFWVWLQNGTTGA
ncbi:MAG TPA: hypothetical protein VGN98_03245, partial [Tianweitania sediminis]|nr:hypothetical protein [Tianweitania sediminis]